MSGDQYRVTRSEWLETIDGRTAMLLSGVCTVHPGDGGYGSYPEKAMPPIVVAAGEKLRLMKLALLQSVQSRTLLFLRPRPCRRSAGA